MMMSDFVNSIFNLDVFFLIFIFYNQFSILFSRVSIISAITLIIYPIHYLISQI
jgi:hypothetical protein